MDLSDSLHSTSVAKTLQVPVDKVSQNLFESLTHIQTVSSFSSSKLSTVSAVLNLMARSLDEAFCEEKMNDSYLVINPSLSGVGTKIVILFTDPYTLLVSLLMQ